MSEIGIALIGAGVFSETHLAAYDAVEGSRITAVVDIDPVRAAALARLAGGVPWSTDVAEVLRRADVQAVDICTPNFTHADIAVDALSAGRHVLVEKPPALSIADFDRMTDAALHGGATLTVGLVLRHTPWARRIRSSLDEGVIGRALVARLSLQSGVIWPGGSDAWQRNRTRSGGHVVHNGMHLIDLAGWYLDDFPVEVMARGYGVAGAVDDHWTLTVRYASGAAAVIEYSYSLPDPDGLIMEVEVVGTDGVLHESSLDSPRIHGARGDRSVFDFRGDSMRRELEEFVATASSGRPHGVPLSEVRSTVAAALAGQQSIDTVRALPVNGVRHVA